MNNEIDADLNTIQKLRQIFAENSDKRILVLGTTCAGKTTLKKACLNVWIKTRFVGRFYLKSLK